tara:strand:+ start:274 stop:906 length:633 start_codon:yes stop_codon:yes gene_type:complete
MISNLTENKGFLAKLLEKGIRILLKKECSKISILKIDIVANSIQIIRGKIKKIYIKAIDINYKNLFFNEIELDADEVKIIFKLSNKEINFKNNFLIKLRTSLSEHSLKKILLSNDWQWIGKMISKELLNQDKLGDITIQNDQLLIKGLKGKNTIDDGAEVDLRTENGKIYLENKIHKKSFQIPIEEKVYFKNVIIKNNLVIISANSSISF